MKKITKKTKFAEIASDEESARILAERGMGCFGCPFAQIENIEQGAKAHGVDADELVKELNKKKKKK